MAFIGCAVSIAVTTWSTTPSRTATFERDVLDQVATAGGTGSDSARSVDVDAAGNRYVVGTVNGSAMFTSASDTLTGLPVSQSSIAVTTATGSELFLTKYSQSGEVLWMASASASSGIDGYSVVVGPGGEIVVTGRFLGTAVFPSARDATTGSPVSSATVSVSSLRPDSASWPGSGFREMVVARYSPQGVVEWAATSGNGTLYNEANSAAVDAQGNVFVTGHMWSDPPTQDGRFRSAISATTGLPVDSKTLKLVIDTWLDVFLAKYSPTGSLEWVVIAGGGAEDRAFGVDVGTDGHPVIAGSYAFGMTLRSARRPSDGNPVPDAGTLVSNTSLTLGNTDWYECFVAKYHSDGTLLWGNRLGASGTDWCEGVDIGPNDRVRVVGQFSNPFTATSATVAATGALTSNGQVAVTSRGGTDLMVSSFSSAGALEWMATGGSSTNDHAWSAESAPNGDLVVTSQLTGSPTVSSAVSAATGSPVNSSTLSATHAGVTGSMVTRFDADGRLTWLANASSTTDVSLVDVTVDTNDRIIAAGSYSGTLTLTSGTTTATLTSSGTDALWVRWGRLPPPTPSTTTTVAHTAATTTTTASIAAPTTTSTTTPSPVRTASGSLPKVKPGLGSAVVDGVRESVRVFVENDTDTVIRGTSFEFRISGECTGNCSVISLADRQVIVLQNRSLANVNGYGFRPGSAVYVWMFSEPRLLGQLVVSADGTFSGQIPLGNIAIGEHTLQVNGTSSDGASRSAVLGVLVGADPRGLPDSGNDPSTVAAALSLVLAGLVIRRWSRQIAR